MRQLFLISFLFCVLPVSSYATITVMVDVSQDVPAARGAIRSRPELKPLAHEYEQIMETHFWPLKIQDITNIFGPKLEEHGIAGDQPTNIVALPLFEPMWIGLSGLVVTNNNSHRTLYAVRDIGYVEFFYHWDNSFAGFVFYARPDERFIPLKTTNDFPKRLDWDKKKFEDFKQWINGHMPKISDLGEVEVSEAKPSRVDLGGNTACILTIREIQHPSVPLWFEVSVTKETTNTEERANSVQRKTIVGEGKIMGFSIDDKFYSMIPKLIRQPLPVKK